jgi:putative endonuclease
MPPPSAKTTGRLGEDLAARHLQQQGYVIIARNVRFSFGEIDIIAQQGETLVFIEVKTRRSHSFGSPFDAVTPRKQQQLIKLAQAYLQGQERLVRFDVVAVMLAKESVTVEVLRNAFEP